MRTRHGATWAVPSFGKMRQTLSLQMIVRIQLCRNCIYSQHFLSCYRNSSLLRQALLGPMPVVLCLLIRCPWRCVRLHGPPTLKVKKVEEIRHSWVSLYIPSTCLAPITLLSCTCFGKGCRLVWHWAIICLSDRFFMSWSNDIQSAGSPWKSCACASGAQGQHEVWNSASGRQDCRGAHGTFCSCYDKSSYCSIARSSFGTRCCSGMFQCETFTSRVHGLCATSLGTMIPFFNLSVNCRHFRFIAPNTCSKLLFPKSKDRMHMDSNGVHHGEKTTRFTIAEVTCVVFLFGDHHDERISSNPQVTFQPVRCSHTFQGAPVIEWKLSHHTDLLLKAMLQPTLDAANEMMLQVLEIPAQIFSDAFVAVQDLQEAWWKDEPKLSKWINGMISLIEPLLELPVELVQTRTFFSLAVYCRQLWV